MDKLVPEAISWLTMVAQNEQFVVELFEHFGDDQKFANHIKLFQNPAPEHQQSLLNLHNIRKLRFNLFCSSLPIEK